MADNFQTVSAGDPVYESAAFRNAVVELLRYHNRQTPSGFVAGIPRAESLSKRFKSVTMVNVKGSVISEFSVVGIGESNVSPQDNAIEFQDAICFNSASPSDGGRFAIATSGCPDDGVFSALVSGVVQVKINRTSTSHSYASSTSGQYDYLTSGSTGLTEILWIDDLPAAAVGQTVHTGTGAPSGGTGVDGDYYNDTSGNQYYGPKTSGSWGSEHDYKTGICWAVVLLNAAVAGGGGITTLTALDSSGGIDGVTGPAGCNASSVAFTPRYFINGTETATSEWPLMIFPATTSEMMFDIHAASATRCGVVSLVAQTFAGDKTFEDAIYADGGIAPSVLVFEGLGKRISFAGTIASPSGTFISATSTDIASSGTRPTCDLNVNETLYFLSINETGLGSTPEDGIASRRFMTYDAHMVMGGANWYAGTTGTDPAGNYFSNGLCLQIGTGGGVTSFNSATGDIELIDSATNTISTTVSPGVTQFSVDAVVADATHAGILSLTTQDIVGEKTFADNATFQGIIFAQDTLNAVQISIAGTLIQDDGGGNLQIIPDGSRVDISGGVTASSFNKVAITQPASGSTLTIDDGKTLTVSNTLTFAGTDGSTLNIGAGGTLGSAAYLTATTVGGNFVTLTNPSAITFPRINADNTVSALDAASFRTAIGVGSGTGDVTAASAFGTDNRIIRSDGTGKGVQASAITIDDTTGEMRWPDDVGTGGSIMLYGGSGAGAAGGSIHNIGGSATGATGGSIAMYGGTASAASGGFIDMHGTTLPGGSLYTYGGGGSIDTTGTGSMEFGVSGTRTTLAGAATANRSISLPDASGTLMLGANNLSDVSNAGTSRTNLGATTVGGNIFTLTNPGAVRFITINADNTVTARSAANFRSDIGAGTGNGDALVANPLSQFASTTSAQLAGVISDETGTGKLVFDTAPVFASTIEVGTAGGTTGLVKLNGTTSGVVSLSVAAAAGTHTIKLPIADGSSGQVLKTDGSGQWGWVAAGGTGTVTSTASADTSITIVNGTTTPDFKINTDKIGYGVPMVNGTLAASVSGNALTIAVKTKAGSDASSTDHVDFIFRNSTATTGDYTVVSLTAALSLTITSGSTMGMTSSVGSRTWIVAFNDGGTIRLGAINCWDTLSIYPLRDEVLASSTAEGGSGGADSAGVIYTGTAVTSKAVRVLGYFEWSSGMTAGTWIAPTKIQLFGAGVALPGTVIQSQVAKLTTVATGTTTVPLDDTKPQKTEGDQYLTCAITPTSAATIIEYCVGIPITANGNVACVASIYVDSDSDPIESASVWFIAGQAGYIASPVRMKGFCQSRSTSSQTYKLRAGGNTGTLTVNGSAGSRYYGGAVMTSITLSEIQA